MATKARPAIEVEDAAVAPHILGFLMDFLDEKGIIDDEEFAKFVGRGYFETTVQSVILQHFFGIALSEMHQKTLGYRPG